MSEIERRHLECFTAVASLGTISAAARSMHVSQPAVSRTLAQLERVVGEQLVNRNTHHLSLTEAGVRFAGPARDAIAALDQALAAARNHKRPLRFGHSWATSDRAAEIARRWRLVRGRCDVQLVFCEERLAGIDRGVCDVALGRGEVDPSSWKAALLATEQRYAIVPSSHRLARRRSVTLGDLAAENIIISTVGTTSPALWPSEGQPANITSVPSTETWLTDIAAGAGVGVTVESIVASRPHPKVRYIPLTDAAPVPLVLVVAKTPTHSSARSFIQAAVRP